MLLPVLLTVLVTERDKVVDFDRVRDTVGERVKGRVVAIPERVTDIVGERERERETVGDRVKGRVVAIPDFVTDTVGERVAKLEG